MTKRHSRKPEEKKPFLSYNKSAKCYMAFSSSQRLSENSEYLALSEQNVKKYFGFNLLCGDIQKSYQQAQNFLIKNKIFVQRADANYLSNAIDSLVVHKISQKMGYGISTYSKLQKNIIILEYIGERKPYSEGNIEYVFLTKTTINTNKWLNSDGNVAITSDDFNTNISNIDPSLYGNIARFFAHCPATHENKEILTANLEIVVWPNSPTSAKVFLVTARDIERFEPLCWDYGPTYNFKDGMTLLSGETYLPIEESNLEL